MNRTWIELDRAALANNIQQFRDRLPANCEIMGVVKAGAYGHGAVPVAKELTRLGVRRFAVAAMSEAVELREAGIEGQILLLGYTHPDSFPLLLQYDLTQTAVCPAHAAQLAAFGREKGTPVAVHIAVDSGMHRIGFLPEELEEIVSCYRSDGLRVTGIFSHLCAASAAEEEPFSRQQARIFHEVLDQLRARDISPGEVHFLASHAAANYPEYAHDFVRLGILMYGAKEDPGAWLRQDMGLRPVMTLKTRITSLRELAPGDTVSYGRTYRAEEPVTIASTAIGYADGLPRTLSGKLRAIVRGQYVHGVGRICMDQMMLDVTGIQGVQVGDEVVLIGRQGDCQILAEEVAERAGTITDEIFTNLAPRVEGRYFV